MSVAMRIYPPGFRTEYASKWLSDLAEKLDRQGQQYQAGDYPSL